jgi:hypothetical protein
METVLLIIGVLCIAGMWLVMMNSVEKVDNDTEI